MPPDTQMTRRTGHLNLVLSYGTEHIIVCIVTYAEWCVKFNVWYLLGRNDAAYECYERWRYRSEILRDLVGSCDVVFIP